MTAVEDGRLGLVLLPGLLPSRALPVPPPYPSDQWLYRTSIPRRGGGGSAWSGLEGIRHPLARFLLRLPATPCLPPYCFPVVLVPVKARSDCHKTEQRKVLKCRKALGNIPTCLPSSLHPQNLSISPSFFFLQTPSFHNPGSHNSSTKHNQLFPTKHGFKMVPCSSPESRRESFGSFRACFCR